MHEFFVLQDFTALIKSMGYIFAGILMLGFIPYFMFLTGREDKQKKKR